MYDFKLWGLDNLYFVVVTPVCLFILQLYVREECDGLKAMSSRNYLEPKAPAPEDVTLLEIGWLQMPLLRCGLLEQGEP